MKTVITEICNTHKFAVPFNKSYYYKNNKYCTTASSIMILQKTTTITTATLNTTVALLKNSKFPSVKSGQFLPVGKSFKRRNILSDKT